MLFISIDDSSHQSESDSESNEPDRRKKRASEPTDRRKKRVLIDVVQDEPNNDKFGMFAIVTD